MTMTPEDAARVTRIRKLLAGYSALARAVTHEGLALVRGIDERFPADASIGKANRWLGFAQGALVACGVRDLDDMKADSYWASRGEYWASRGEQIPPYLVEDPSRRIERTRRLHAAFMRGEITLDEMKALDELQSGNATPAAAIVAERACRVLDADETMERARQELRELAADAHAPIVDAPRPMTAAESTLIDAVLALQIDAHPLTPDLVSAIDLLVEAVRAEREGKS
jgi:hypothetical protein